MFNKKYYKIPLDKFINSALYDPKKGYYMRTIPFGKQGDFVTSPNISNIFSEMIFIWIISYWKKFYKNKKINVIELCAGNGEMLHQIIKSAKNFNFFFDNCNFFIYEKSQKLKLIQKTKLKNNKVKWLKDFKKLDNYPSIFIGNEFLDALPIKQFENIKNNWYEKYVLKNGKKFSFTKEKSNIRKIEKKLKLNVSKNQNFLEISLEIIKIIKQLSKIICKKGGCILFIDYAYLNNKMLDTLQAVRKHKTVNVLKNVGRSDISHVINIPFLKKIAKKSGLDLKYVSQREFLLNLGILQRAEILSSKKSFLEKANIYYRVNRLIDKKQMGELFKVIYFHNKNNFNIGFK